MLEGLAYALARGAVRAYLDVLSEQKKVYMEPETNEDAELANRFAAAVAYSGCWVPESPNYGSEPEYSPQTDRACEDEGGSAAP